MSKVTAKSKRWKQRITLLQNVLRARESLNRAQDSLDNVMRELVEEEEDALESPSSEPPTSSPTSKSHPSNRPTVFHEAMNSSAVVRLLLRRWSEANTEDKRASVRDVARRCLETKTITLEEHAALEVEFK